ncbi:DUF2167 domain-containing protein [Lysobacter niastensis]|uniref:DUF2167 domain-containing protein n=1 Tax=Lysobacter niastensis TaxID=380629 RepID=A0ABS0B511_9GAMM|nr:DUF2167 domain-containing protein [Lysobacter niastensis]MBF6023723.1 DUF2167 domain-containing protein [Lysobacter niastensis]
MRKHLFAVLAAAAFALAAVVMPAAAQEAQGNGDIGDLPWQVGPAKGKVGDKAVIDVPEGYAFLDADGTRKLNEMLENPPTDAEEYTLAPKDMEWLSFFRFNEVGYIEDKEELDADAILDSVKEGTAESNVERKQRGWETFNIVGWSFKPQYDKQTNLLEWAILAEGMQSHNKVVNYNTRLLGRRGVMEVIVVSDPDGLDAAITQFKKVLPGYSFNSGEKYAEFKPGDHVAEYGLAALITGGAAAVASKKGFFAAIAVFLAKAWKLLLIGVAGGWAAVRKFFAGKKEQPAE